MLSYHYEPEEGVVPKYHDVTGLLAWLDEQEEAGPDMEPLNPIGQMVAQVVRAKLGPEVTEKAMEARDVWEVPDIPRDRHTVWTADQYTGESVRWREIDSVRGTNGGCSRLWIHEVGGSRYTDLELLGQGPVYGYDFNAVEAPETAADASAAYRLAQSADAIERSAP